MPPSIPSSTRIAGSSCTRPPTIGAVRGSGAIVPRTVLVVPRASSRAVPVASMPSTSPTVPVTPSARSPVTMPRRFPGSASL